MNSKAWYLFLGDDMMKYTYLLIDVLTIAVPFMRSFEYRLRFYKKWRFLIPSLIITATIFIIWDHFFTVWGIWSFNHKYTLSLDAWSLPAEEILFFISVPYSCLFIYEVLNFYKPKRLFRNDLRMVVLIAATTFCVLAFFARSKAYPLSVTFGMAVFLIASVRLLRPLQLENYILTFFISIMPMLIVNGILTALPVVVYNDQQNWGLRLGTIPVEDFLYGALLLGINICLYEVFQRGLAERGK